MITLCCPNCEAKCIRFIEQNKEIKIICDNCDNVFEINDAFMQEIEAGVDY